MNQQILSELKAYIDMHLIGISTIRKNRIQYNIGMPLQGVVGKNFSKRKERVMEPEEEKLFLKRFRKDHFEKLEEPIEEIYLERCMSPEEQDLKAYIDKEKSDETFSTQLFKFIDSTGLTDAEVYKKAGIDRRHFSKIRCDRDYRPKKSTALALCLALELPLEEAASLLKLAGYSLSSCDTGDLIVKFCIERRIYNLFNVNEALDYFGQKVLGV